MLRLDELQHAFFRNLVDSSRLGQDRLADSVLADEIQGDARLGASGRVEVYARMYRARLIEALTEDYPRIAAILGPTLFHEVAHDYVEARPSTRPSLRWFGDGFAAFLSERDDPNRPPYLVDLARLEWARLAVFDAAEAQLLDLEQLRRVPPDGWTTLRLALIPAVEIVRVGWPVHRIWEAGAAGESSVMWAPEAGWLRVWRQDDKVFQASMDDAERTALEHVRAGDDFAELCEGLATMVAPERAAETAGALILRWIEDGVLRGDTVHP